MGFKVFIYDTDDTSFSNPVDISKYAISCDIKLGYESTANIVNLTLRNIHNKIMYGGINIKETPNVRLYIKKGFVDTSVDLPDATGQIITVAPKRDASKTTLVLKITDSSFLLLNKVVNFKKKTVEGRTAPSQIIDAIQQVATDIGGDGSYTIDTTGVAPDPAYPNDPTKHKRSDGSDFPNICVGASNMRLSKFIEMLSTPEFTGDNVNYIYWLELKIVGSLYKIKLNWTFPLDVVDSSLHWYDTDLISESPSFDKSNEIFQIINTMGTDLENNLIRTTTKNNKASLKSKVVTKNYTSITNRYYTDLIDDGIIVEDTVGVIFWADKSYAMGTGYDLSTYNTLMRDDLQITVDAINQRVFRKADFAISVTYKGVKTITQGGLYTCDFPSLNINENLRCFDKQLIFRPTGIFSTFKFKPDPKTGGTIETWNSPCA